MNPRRIRRLHRLVLLGLGVCVLGAVGAVRAGDDEHDLARRAVEQGRVLPLRSVLGRVEREVPGQPLKVEFERDDSRFVYKIRMLQPDGRIAKVEVDAVDGRILRIRRKELPEDPDAHPRR